MPVVKHSSPQKYFIGLSSSNSCICCWAGGSFPSPRSCSNIDLVSHHRDPEQKEKETGVICRWAGTKISNHLSVFNALHVNIFLGHKNGKCLWKTACSAFSNKRYNWWTNSTGLGSKKMFTHLSPITSLAVCFGQIPKLHLESFSSFGKWRVEVT